MSDSTYWQNYRIRIYPSKEQEERMFQIINVFRYVYNWGLSKYKENYKETGKSTTKFTLAKQFTEHRHSPGFEWLEDYDITTCRFALWNVIDAFVGFYTGRNRYPLYKSKKNAYKKTFQVRGERLRFLDDGTVQIPGVTGKKTDKVKCGKHRIPLHGVQYHNVYVSYVGNEFWLSLSVRMYKPFVVEDQCGLRDEPLGVDVGLKNAATLSDGTTYAGPNRHRSKVLRNRLAKLKSAISKDVRRRMIQSARTKTKYADIPKSKNQLKREARMRKTYRDIVNLYQGRYHQISSAIVKKNPEFVVIEDLPVREICRENKYLSDELTQARLGTLLKYIEYKCNREDIPIYRAPRDYPSTQTCCRCGHIQKIGTATIYRCPECGMVLDRDINAALNLRDYGDEVFYDQRIYG